jgi:hypothetical protein
MCRANIEPDDIFAFIVGSWKLISQWVIIEASPRVVLKDSQWILCVPDQWDPRTVVYKGGGGPEQFIINEMVFCGVLKTHVDGEYPDMKETADIGEYGEEVC